MPHKHRLAPARNDNWVLFLWDGVIVTPLLQPCFSWVWDINIWIAISAPTNMPGQILYQNGSVTQITSVIFPAERWPAQLLPGCPWLGLFSRYGRKLGIWDKSLTALVSTDHLYLDNPYLALIFLHKIQQLRKATCERSALVPSSFIYAELTLTALTRKSSERCS